MESISKSRREKLTIGRCELTMNRPTALLLCERGFLAMGGTRLTKAMLRKGEVEKGNELDN